RLRGATVGVRTARPARSIRANWDDGSTRLVIAFTARGEAKSQVALTHERVPDAGTADKLKAFWRERMAALRELLEACPGPARRTRPGTGPWPGCRRNRT